MRRVRFPHGLQERRDDPAQTKTATCEAPGSWCNGEHIGLLSREGGGSNPSGPTGALLNGRALLLSGSDEGSTPPAPRDHRGGAPGTARSSTAERSADNRKTKVQLLPGRLGDTRDPGVSGSMP